MSKSLKWGIIGTGNIAKTFAKGVAMSKTGKLIAVASRAKDKAEKFAADFKVPKAYGSYDDLLKDKEVEAVYISTPHPFHAEWAIKAADAKKHILCEKPIGINHPEAMAIVEAAHRNDVFLMEAFMYRCHPQTAKLVELLRKKVIGEVRVIQVTFSFGAGFNPEARLFSNALAGGGILDVGCYCTSMARLIAGAANGKEIVEPIEVKGTGYLGQTGVDEYAVAVLKFPGNIVAELATGVSLNQESVVRIFGTEGNIYIPSPWFANGKIVVTKAGKSEDVICEAEAGLNTKEGLYALEADEVAENVEKRQGKFPAMTWDDTLGNMKTMDSWRTSFKFIYNAEKNDANIPTADRRELSVRKDSNMKYGKLEGVDKKISRLVMGTMLEAGNDLPLPYATAMFDEFYAKGGNCFDTAWVYGGAGKSEIIFGQWMKNRKIREKIVVIAKGAHTPACNPKDLSRQLNESFERMKIDYADIYFMHRDNTDIPAGEFIDVLNEHKKAGRIKAFGGSNWSLERVKEANEYAKKKGLTGFLAVSNNFSLARLVEPMWGGCISSSDKDSREWFIKTQISLFSWSSQARGFFSGAADPKNTSNAELVRCWYCDDNFKRLERAKELAKKYKVLPITIALAYVLCQPFPTYALMGPRTLAEIRTSFDALDINLPEKEIRWLNLE